VNVALNIVLTNILGNIDALEIQFSEEFLFVNLIKNFKPERSERRVDDIAPKTADHDTVSRLLLFPRDKRAHGTIGRGIGGKASLECDTIHSPILVFSLVNMSSHFNNPHLIVPVNDVPSKIIPISEMVPQSLISELFNIKRMLLKVLAENFLHFISFLELKNVKIDDPLEYALASLVFSNKLNQFFDNIFQIIG